MSGKKVVYIHHTYPDGSHDVDCSGCVGKVAAILREWIYDRERDDLADPPGVVAARVLSALAEELD